MIDVTIQRRLFFGFALGPVALLVVGWIAYTNIQSMVELRDERNQSFTLLDGLSSVMADAVNAETGQRGYLLVGEESYLAPFQAGRDALGNDLRKVMTLSNGNPQRQQELQRLQTVLQSKLDELTATVALRRTKGLDAAMATVRAGTGKTYMDEGRGIIAQVRSEEGNRLGELTADLGQRGPLYRQCHFVRNDHCVSGR